MTTTERATAPAPDDEVLRALDDLLEVLRDHEHVELIVARAEQLRARRAEGAAYSETVDEESRPLIVEVLSEHIQSLLRTSARFRRAEAAALHAEGLTMDRIAELFGVTRQRVSTLLKEARAGS
ncbi:MAG: helix-turn-helix domain-containing protein [Actinobacteria bacterium]|nr:helix-turn-helix domain-containing protein [Actinomycetota bacterium]